MAIDADLQTTCGALLDALAQLELALSEAERGGADPTLDLSAVNVLVDRSFPGEVPSETDQALRSMRDSTVGVVSRIWYRRGDAGWAEDCAAAPTWPLGDPVVERWVDRLLLPRLTAAPSRLARTLVEAVDDPSLQLYPSEVTAGSTDVWALRLDGLQIGTASPTTATLTIGKPGKSGDGPQRKVFIEVFRQPSVTVSTAEAPPPGALSVDDAAHGIRSLLRRFRAADVRGAPITHRARGEARIIDEHTLEARLLKGVIPFADAELVLDDDVVARGSQFPTLWGHGGRARYLDALLRRGDTPLAVELKVATGGQGRYYRRSLVQLVLYRHFIRNAPGLEPWFRAAGLSRIAAQGCVGVPIPDRWTPRFTKDLELLTRVGERVGARVHVLDDRRTPDWVAVKGLPEPGVDEQELLSWRLAAALSSRWPISLGRVVERHDCGGFYDQLQLQGTGDRRLDWPSPLPRVSLNRPGSLWVFSQTGATRWTWRQIWNHLARGGDAGEAAAIVGAIAGLVQERHAAGPCFAEAAVAFLEAANEPGWSWRCAWPDGVEVSSWVERYRGALTRYSRASAGDVLPTIARIWGAIRDDEAAVILDQENLRAWMWIDGTVKELREGDPVERIRTAAKLVASTGDPAPTSLPSQNARHRLQRSPT